jgi:hypothetical protein
MSGHVFHPGHSALHGMTVVVETRGEKTYVGRYDSEDAAGVHLLDVGVHDAQEANISKDEYLRRSAKYGIRTDHKHITIPPEQVAGIKHISQLG